MTDFIFEAKLHELMTNYGKIKVEKVMSDIISSNKTEKVVQQCLNQGIVPDGDSCVSCVMSNWRYAFAGTDKVEIGSVVVLMTAYESLNRQGTYISESTLLDVIEEIDNRIRLMKFK